MKLSVKTPSSTLSPKDLCVLLIGEDELENISAIVPEAVRKLIPYLSLDNFRAKSQESLYIPLADSPALLLLGLGKTEKITIDTLRSAGAAIITQCRNRSISDPTVFIRSLAKLSDRDVLKATAEGMYLFNYEFNKYKTPNPEKDKPLIEKTTFLTTSKNAKSLLSEIAITCDNTLQCRNLVNETSDAANATNIATLCKTIAKKSGMKCTVYNKRDIEKMKMGLLLAVNRASAVPPQLVHLSYKGNPKSKRSVTLVGKGITFDSGGINLKPSGFIETMRMDMGGAATVLYIIKCAAELKLKINVDAVIPLTDNMINAEAYRPGDIFTSYSGKTVEIGNTDAEGRLILADALSFAEKKLKPSYIIDMATLTGACLVALGETVAALLSTDDDLRSVLKKAAETTGEKIWEMPLYEEFQENLKSDVADIINVPAERNGGTINAAIFLKSFIKDTPWAHIDIAGTAWYSKPRGCMPKNATGYGVRLVIDAIKELDL